jgi:hypothetical protein
LIKKHQNTEIINHDILRIVFQETVITIHQFPEFDKPITFGDILSRCKECGYSKGTILLIAESATEGAIYRYGNYADEYWYEVGEMKGFA